MATNGSSYHGQTASGQTPPYSDPPATAILYRPASIPADRAIVPVPTPSLTPADIERSAYLAGGTAALTFALARRGWALLALPIGLLLLARASGRDPFQPLVEAVNKAASPTAAPPAPPNRDGVPANQGVHVRKSITINRPVADLYSLLTDPTHYPDLLKLLPNVAITPTAWNELRIDAANGHLPITLGFEPVNNVENEVIAWKSPYGADFQHAGAIRFVEAPGDRGTELHLQFEYVPPAGTVGQAALKLFGVEPEQLAADLLRRFKQWVEAGEIATTDGQPSGRE